MTKTKAIKLGPTPEQIEIALSGKVRAMYDRKAKPTAIHLHVSDCVFIRRGDVGSPSSRWCMTGIEHNAETLRGPKEEDGWGSYRVITCRCVKADRSPAHARPRARRPR